MFERILENPQESHSEILKILKDHLWNVEKNPWKSWRISENPVKKSWEILKDRFWNVWKNPEKSFRIVFWKVWKNPFLEDFIKRILKNPWETDRWIVILSGRSCSGDWWDRRGPCRGSRRWKVPEFRMLRNSAAAYGPSPPQGSATATKWSLEILMAAPFLITTTTTFMKYIKLHLFWNQKKNRKKSWKNSLKSLKR